MKIIIKTSQQISSMRKGGKILASIVKELSESAKVGKSTLDLENESNELLKKYNAKSAFRGYEGYMFNTCMSVNDVIEHGIPSKNVILEKGDLLKIDMGVIYENTYTDHAVCVIIGGETSPQRKKLYDCSKLAMEASLNDLKAGVNVKTISKKINDTADLFGFSPVRELVGHGVGTTLHEDPNISCYYPTAIDYPLKENMTIAIETMINAGNWKMKMDKDGWTLRTVDGSDSSMFEHTILINKNGYEILTLS